ASKRGPDDSPKLPIVSAEAGLLWSQCTEFERDNYQSVPKKFIKSCIWVTPINQIG
ncbi:5517_t:CDS:1, partial [Entrophospora sp. SA101]